MPFKFSRFCNLDEDEDDDEYEQQRSNVMLMASVRSVGELRVGSVADEENWVELQGFHEGGAETIEDWRLYTTTF